MSRPVTLIAWRNANPYPDDDQPTGPGRDVLVFPPGQGIRWDDTRHVLVDSASVGAEPYLWSDPPVPPGPDALTVEDLRRVAAVASFAIAENGNRCGIQDADGMALLARLRAALDALGNGGTE